MMKKGLMFTLAKVGAIPELSTMAEEAGFDSLWTPDYYWRDATVALALMATSTRRIRIGSDILHAFLRTPVLTANMAFDIDELSNGRLILGLGVGTRRMNTDWYNVPFDPPVRRLRESVQLLRTVWASHKGGKPLEFKGEFHGISHPLYHRPGPPLRERIPIYFAAVGPHMIRATAEMADGLLGTFGSRWYVENVVCPHLMQGLRSVGRERKDVEVAQFVITSISRDGQEARREVKQTLAYYLLGRPHSYILDAHGWEKEKVAIQEAARTMDRDKMIAAVSDEMLDALAIAGTPDEARSRWKQYFEGWLGEGIVDLLIFYLPWYRVHPDRGVENARAILETFAE
jgi:probable F420-dependent oxidoreductase